ncbi:SDR family NAD(P)-dependent oxidoreductase [Pseudonocardia sp. GCM10023141]|uniref:SDR family NAD(P)-dependent oxidoreductase n=1 Tax=Pseudonocardia sp. GCM10023141 TaxID=3252653 RepID=UPI0036157AA0
MTAPRPLAGRVALVTGAGRPRGIGCAVAVRLAAAGADVVVTDLARDRGDLRFGTVGLGDSPEALEAVAGLVREQGARGLAVSLDVTDAEQAAVAVDSAVARFGGLDILVNNAGTGVGVGDFLTVTDAEWNLSWQVNVLGAARMCRLAAPHLGRRGPGCIVNIASTAGLAGMAGYGAYTVTKHAVVGLTRLLAAELGPRDIRVNAVAPGMIHTDMGAAELEMIADAEGLGVDEATRNVVASIPLRRLGLATDVAVAVGWLVADAGYVTGTVIPVHGGIVSGLV